MNETALMLIQMIRANVKMFENDVRKTTDQAEMRKLEEKLHEIWKVAKRVNT